MPNTDTDPGVGLNGAAAAVLRAELAAQRISQVKLSERAGVAPVSLQRYLAGTRHMNVETLGLIARALGVTPERVIHEAEKRLRESYETDPDADLLEHMTPGQRRAALAARRAARAAEHGNGGGEVGGALLR